MNYKKFGPDDILQNTIKTYPQNSIFVDSTGSIYIKNLGQVLASNNKSPALVAGSGLNLLEASSSYKLNYDINLKYNNISPVNSNIIDLYTNNSVAFNHYFSSSINFHYVSKTCPNYFYDPKSINGANQAKKLVSLKNTLDWYSGVSPSYKFSNFITKYQVGENNSISVELARNSPEAEEKDIAIINIPSCFYGSSIKRGSVELNFYITGTLIGKLQDYRYNGELIETVGPRSNVTDGTNIAGVVLYDEGLILLNGSWELGNFSTADRYKYCSGSLSETKNLDFPRWRHFGKSVLSSSLLIKSSFGLEFQGTNTISSMTMLLHANKNEANMSNNKTFIKHGQEDFNYVQTSSNSYTENKEIFIKNTIHSPYTNLSASFKKQTFINKIGIYDQDRKLIAIAKLATPVKKNNEREYTFKLKLDI